jgi:hypothetical protein
MELPIRRAKAKTNSGQERRIRKRKTDLVNALSKADQFGKKHLARIAKKILRRGEKSWPLMTLR